MGSAQPVRLSGGRKITVMPAAIVGRNKQWPILFPVCSYEQHSQNRTLLSFLPMQDCAWNTAADAYEVGVTRKEEPIFPASTLSKNGNVYIWNSLNKIY